MNKSFFIGYIFFVICFFIPSIAYAYLDPGTGNALLYVILSLTGAIFYYIKGFFYRAIKKKSNQSSVNESKTSKSQYDSIVIFNEGKAYWPIFKPVVEKLIEKKQHFSYYTMDINDPCLLIDNQYMNNRFIGDGNVAYVKMGNLSANIVLSTTPNIGTEGYPIPRSKKIRKLVHISHGFNDFSFYHKGSLDYYDAVMLVGAFEIPIIRKLEVIRALPKKELYPAGLPYMDELIQKANHLKNHTDKCSFCHNPNGLTVLLAPSWGRKGFLYSYGTDFIENLANKNFNLILRPHPQSLKVEKKLIKHIEDKFKKYNNIVWDFNPDGTESFQNADILISDTSGIRLDFALVYQKPFITIPISFSQETLQDFEISDIGYSWNEEAMKEIGYGYTLKESEIDEIDKIIINVLNKKDDKAILEFRNNNIYNLGKSGEIIADYLITNNSH